MVAVLFIVACVADPLRGTFGQVAFAAVPQRLTDEEFWKLSADLSEPEAALEFDNLMSNEILFQHVIPDLVFHAKSRRHARTPVAYIGVGPEQNFTYIAALKPAVAFIIDLRRANLNLHLLYKALFEMSVNRAQFVSLLFSRPRPDGLAPSATAKDIFAVFAKIPSSEEHYQKNLRAVTDRLVRTHGFPLSPEDIQEIESVYQAFFRHGPRMRYPSRDPRGLNWPSYQDLMTATDDDDEERSFLAGEAEFAVVKNLQARNLIVPLVGNFVGPKTIRAVGQYLEAKGTVVSAFYVSNVEQYLDRDEVLGDFCLNVATLPLDAASMFIRSTFHELEPLKTMAAFKRRPGFNSKLGIMAEEIKNCAAPSAR